MDPPTFSELYGRYAVENMSVKTIVRLNDASQSAEALNVVRYLATFGFRITTVEEIFHAIEALDGEEELTAFRCREGIAVSHASDGWWILFEHPTVAASK